MPAPLLDRRDLWRLARVRASAVILGVVLAIQGVDRSQACSVVLFRHVQKTGGSSIRKYFGHYYPAWECIGQYCPGSAYPPDDLPDDADTPAKKKRNRRRRQPARIDEDKILAILWQMTKVLSREPQTESEKEEYQVAMDRKIMIEVHTRTQNPSDFVHYLNALSTLRSETNCTTLSLIMLRNPLSHIYSDMTYFNKRYRSFEGNFTEFIEAYPEDLLRWVGTVDYEEDRANSKLVYYGLDQSTYPSDTDKQAKLKSETIDFLDQFNMVGVTERINDLWKYICRTFDLNQNIYSLGRSHGKPEKDAIACEDLSSKIVNPTRTRIEEAMHEKALKDNEALSHQYNPVAFALFEKYSKQFDEQYRQWVESKYSIIF